ncbi:MAG: class IIb bacteriocin, lactobin A/cerein 7B family [Bacteroidales bacterium]|jgi:lactobin A/cerein 7B family class IIb bacteriocin|nr:class IIb bacteriocin, lactobin A/cerein 7B family [Bacteroidales bacterium]
MKNLDLKAMGVEEMNFAEMQNVDGGSLLAAACIILAVLYIAGTCCGLAQGHKFNGQP